VSADDKTIAVGDERGRVCGWSRAERRLQYCAQTLSMAVGDLAFASELLAAVSMDSVAIVRGESGAGLHGFDSLVAVRFGGGAPPADGSIAVAPDGERLFASTSIGFWSVDWLKNTTLRRPSQGFGAIGYLPSAGELLAARDREILWVDEGTLAVRRRRTVSEEPLSVLEVSRDGRRVAVAGGRRMAVLDARTGARHYGLLTREGTTVSALAWAPDGSLLAAGVDLQTVVLEGTTGRVLATLGAHEDEVTAVAFTGAGDELLSASRDGTVVAWDVSPAARVAWVTPPDAASPVQAESKR
jgi:WD40 repeat protein